MLRIFRHVCSFRGIISGQAKPHLKHSRIFGAALGLIGVSSLASFLVANAEEPVEVEEKAKLADWDIPTPRKRSEQSIIKDEKYHIEYFDYVIIGGGAAGSAALDELKAENAEGSIALFSRESNFRHPQEGHLIHEWVEENVYMYLDTSVLEMMPFRRILRLSDGTHVAYGKCVVCTGSAPIPLNAPHPKSTKITTFGGEYDVLEKIAQQPGTEHITVLGGSQESSELACILSLVGKQNNVKVSLVVPGSGVLSQYFRGDFSEQLNQKFRKSCGVELKTNAEVEGIDENLNVYLNNGQQFKTDHVVVARGWQPDTSVLPDAVERDEVNSGLVCNSQLKVISGLWAAGSIASFFDPFAMKRRRFSDLEHSRHSGRTAARNMLGHEELFYGDTPVKFNFLDDEYILIGDTNPKYQMTGVFLKGPLHSDSRDNIYEKHNNMNEGIFYYTQEGKIVGAAIWNIKDQHIIEGAAVALARNSRVYAETSDLVRSVPFEKPQEKETKQ